MDTNSSDFVKYLLENYHKLALNISHFDLLIQSNTKDMTLETLDLIDVDLIAEIKHIENNGIASIYFGKTLRDIKCIIEDNEYIRQHDIFIQYKGPKKLYISSINLPYSNIQNVEYNSILEIISVFIKHINELSCYLYELELIDKQCTIMEPVNPTFKDDYRRILIEGRTWLHVEVSPAGLATNIHLIGRSKLWHDKLEIGLQSWDHDKNIVTNIMTIFDLTEFPQDTRKLTCEVANQSTFEQPVCLICLCAELPGLPNVPQPLCQNLTCGVYFHRSCLYEWLVTSEPMQPVFVVATGSCPSCLQPIACNKTD